MSIRCKHCDDRVPEWDSRDESCLTCWEQYERPTSVSQEEEEEVEAWV